MVQHIPDLKWLVYGIVLPPIPAMFQAITGLFLCLRCGSIRPGFALHLGVSTGEPRSSKGNGSKPGTLSEHQDGWDLWMFIPLKIVFIEFLHILRESMKMSTGK